MAYRYSYLLGHSHSHMYLPTQPCPVSDCPQFTIDSNSIRGHRNSWGQKKIEETLAAMRSAKGSSPSCQAVQRSSDPAIQLPLGFCLSSSRSIRHQRQPLRRSTVQPLIQLYSHCFFAYFRALGNVRTLSLPFLGIPSLSRPPPTP